MKRILILMSLTAWALIGCTQAYDDTEIKNMLEDLEARTEALKDLCERVNTSIVLVNRLEEARQLNVKVIEVVPDKDADGKVTGYAVTLSDGTVLKVNCPPDGKDGYVGKPGEAAQVPAIGIVQHKGEDCWAIGGELVKDENGNPVPLYSYAGGEKRDGRTPELKVEGGKWYYRLETTGEWTPIDVSVVYGDGNLFSSVQEDGDKVMFHLSAGGSLALEKAMGFSLKLETLSALVKAGNQVEVSYTLSTDDPQTKVEAFVPVGWTASVADAKVTVSAPADAAAGTSVQVVVFATRTDGESVCQVLNVTVE